MLTPLLVALAAAQLHTALTHFRERRFVEARESIERALTEAPGDARAWKLLGMTYSAEENYAAAEAPFEKACRLAPSLEDACYYLGRDRYLLNKFEAAEQAFSAAIKRGGKPWRAHGGLALTLEALGRIEAAERGFRRAAELAANASPRPPENPRIDYGAFLFRQGRLDEAIRELGLAPSCFRTHFERGKVLAAKERLEQAAQELEKALTFPDREASAALLLAKVYSRLGRAGDAEKLLAAYTGIR